MSPAPISSEAVASPAVLTGEAEAARHGGMRLSGIVRPNGSSTSFYFQWGEGQSYAATRVMGPVESSAEVAVEIPERELRPGTTYHYRLVATSSLGTTMGAQRSFVTPQTPRPSVTTGRSRWVDTTAVTLTGVVDPANEPIAWYFEYGPTTAYGMTTRGGVLDGAQAKVATSEPIEGLLPGATFHYRLVGRRGTMLVHGEDAIFITPHTPSLAARLRAATQSRRRHGAPPPRPQRQRSLHIS
jgi:hypothetical protein